MSALCRESDGLGASLMAVVCAWCGTSLGANVCAPSEAGKSSHGICKACAIDMRADFDRSRGHSDASSCTARPRCTGANGIDARPISGASTPAVDPAASVTFNGDKNL